MELKFPLLLASGSPRRKELLEKAGLDFSVVSLPSNEAFKEIKDYQKIAIDIAKSKLYVYKQEYRNHTILCADTIVVANNQILGKPKSDEDSFRMLRLISGSRHDVITGVIIESPEYSESFAVCTSVDFYTLCETEIASYISDKLSVDKAGAYGIQDWIGLIGVKSIQGDYNNVVGLPISQVYQVLKSKFC